MAHERLIGDKGRKVVQERVGGTSGQTEQNEFLMGITPDEKVDFDQQWKSMADNMGFTSQNKDAMGWITKTVLPELEMQES